MKSGISISRILSALLTVLLACSSLCIPVSAEGKTIKILSFPDTSINSVSFMVGISESEVISSLPNTLLANVEIYYDTSEVPKGTDSTKECKENYSVPVTWYCNNYNSDSSGSYDFKAQIVESGYECSDITFPTISVELYEGKIEEKPVEKEYFDENPTLEPPGKEPEPVEVDPGEENPAEENPAEDSGKTPDVTPTPSSEEKPASDASTNNTSGNSGSSSQGGSNQSSSSKNSSSSGSSSSQATKPATSSTTTSNAVAPTTPANNNATQNQSNTAVDAKSDTTKKKSTNSNASTEKAKENDDKKIDEKAEEKTAEESTVKKIEDIPISVANKSNTQTELIVGDGKAVIDVKNEESSEISSIITDEMTLLKNILTEEQLKKLAAGSTANIRISTNLVKESDLSEADANAIKEGVEKYKESIPGLCIAGYVDIGIYLQMDDEDWSYVSNTNKPVELVINVPDSVKNISSDYYVLRLHDGKTEMFVDDDDNPDTITISSGKFSIYIVMYDSEAAAEIEKSEKKEMTTLVFVVSALILILLIQIIYIFFIRKRLHFRRN